MHLGGLLGILDTRNSIILEGGVFMATSSITKTFVVKDKEVYDRFVADISKAENNPKNISAEQDKLEAGRKALAQFSFR